MLKERVCLQSQPATFAKPGEQALPDRDCGSSLITGDTIQLRKKKKSQVFGSVKLFFFLSPPIFFFFVGCGAFSAPVRGSQCLPSIPAGLFCHRLCAARHGRRRRQRVGQPSPTAVLLRPGTRRRPRQYENKFSPLFAINFPLLQRKKKKEAVLTT